jgi:2-polyprenyl-3-methyl-5-hydroxy-6-metoxy-1,4-benzoquinol methylase
MPKDHMEELYSSKNPLVNFVHNNRLDSIVRFLKNRMRNKRILDAGCGEGHLIEKLSHQESSAGYYGIDIVEPAVSSAKQRCPAAFIQLGDLYATKYPPAFFDVVICTEVLEHIIDFKLVLKEFKRILKANGLLIITFPNEVLWTVSRFFLGRRPIKVPDHVNSFSPSKIKKYVNLPLVYSRSMPFNLPFPLSLGKMMVFKK